LSTAGGVWKALQRGLGIGCEIIQIFGKNNMQWFGKPCSPSGVAKFASELAASKLASVFGHTGYLIDQSRRAALNQARPIHQIVGSGNSTGRPVGIAVPGDASGRASRRRRNGRLEQSGGRIK